MVPKGTAAATMPTCRSHEPSSVQRRPMGKGVAQNLTIRDILTRGNNE
ncbi:hypothetical protein ANO14919_131650 [Xylariales sp. No.14919]|nr:hypothetical protein ANO14919_131650 [Xylariales sp. No.14919]